MTRFSGIVWLLTALFATHCAGAQDRSGEQPNVVVIISDDQAYHDFGFMNHPVIQTPHIDRLASESLLFTRGYVTTALCCPSLATMLTGAYPHQHGFTGNDPAKGWGHRQEWIDHFRRLPQLPALLQQNGYLSLHTGKYWQGHPERVSGFTDSMGETLRHGSQASLGVGRDTMQPIYDFMAKARDASKPFMVWYAPFLPHTPHTPPERLLNKYRDKAPRIEMAKYFAMVDWFDETCGELLQHIDEKGLRDNTVVLFICDNGWPQGAGGYRGHKLTPWEQGVRTPIMIRWPGKVAPKRDEIRLASNIDIPTTILAAAGLPIPESMPGINLLDEATVKKRDCVFIEDFAHDMIAPDEPEKTLEARGVICGDWKLMITYAERDNNIRKVDRVFLFDLKNDPKEQRDLAGQRPEIQATLMAKLNEWWKPDLPEHDAVSLRQPLTGSFTFKTAGDAKLRMKLYRPPGWKIGGKKLPAVVFFFGGGWHGGDISQFNAIGPYLARRGMIVVTPEYRTIGKHGVKPNQCLEDAKSAMRYVHQNAERLGIDKNRIAAGGRSAGGHLAAAAAFARGFDADGDDLSIPCKPAALVLFNPVIDNGPGGFAHHLVKDYWEGFSPLHNISANPPPTLFLTGDRDQYTPFVTAQKYKFEMEKHSGSCDLVIFKDGVHGSPFAKEHYQRTLQEMDGFFVSLGYLTARNQK